MDVITPLKNKGSFTPATHFGHLLGAPFHSIL